MSTNNLIKDELVLDIIDSIIEIHSKKDSFKQSLKISAKRCCNDFSYEVYVDTYDKLMEMKYYDPVKHEELFQTAAYQIKSYLKTKNLWVE